jgi:hypothetical protein
LYSLKNYIQKKSLGRAYRKNQRPKLMLNFRAIKSIGILSDPENQEELKEIIRIIELFKQEEKKVYPLFYIEKKNENTVLSDAIEWTGIGKENCNWLGTPKNDVNLSRFLNKKFGLLLNLSYRDNYSLNSVFVRSKAQLKAVPTEGNKQIYADLTLKVQNSKGKATFTSDLIHYLKIINKDQK